MRKRLKTIGGGAAALVALALGGSAIASATQGTSVNHKKPAVSTPAAAEKTGGPNTDRIQSGDQTSPDTKNAKASSASTSETPDTGSESEAPDTGSATESSSE